MSSSLPTPPSGEDVHTPAGRLRRGITTARCSCRAASRTFHLPAQQAGQDFSEHIEQALKTGMDRFHQTFGRGDGSMFPANIILIPFPLRLQVENDLKASEALKKTIEGISS